MSLPAVSVLMGVRDGAPWVAEAIESILGQTLADLELIVVDDGSTDDTPTLLAGMRDPRLVVEWQPPKGLTRALGRAFARARAPLVARLDADDVARPDRLERQHAFLAAHPEVGLLGSAARVVDEAGREVGDDPAARGRRDPAPHADPAQSVRPLLDHGALEAGRAGGRLRSGLPGRAGLRSLAAAQRAHPDGQPARGAGDPTPRARGG